MSWGWPTAKTAWPTCSSARPPTTWDCTASRWPATPRFGRMISACCWTVRLPIAGRSSVRPRRCGRAGISATASSSRRCTWDGTRSSGIARWWPAWVRRLPCPRSCLDAPLGYLTAYGGDRPDPSRAVELWPRLLARRPHLAALFGFSTVPGHCEHLPSIYNARKLLDAADLWGEPTLPASFARAMLKIPREETLDDWLQRVETSANHVRAGQELAEELRRRILPTVPVSVGQRKGPSPPALGACPGLTPRSVVQPSRLPGQAGRLHHKISPDRRSPIAARPRDRSRWPTGERSSGWPMGDTSAKRTPIVPAIP